MAWRRSGLIAALIVVVAGLAYAGVRIAGERGTLNAPFDPHTARFVGSAACESCHEDRHESWYATYHRTMTQEATAASVQGRFDGQSLDYWGLRVRPIEENGRYFFEYADPATGEVLNRLPIDRTVGSHRYQQYLTRLPEDGTYVRLHYLWHNGDRRWVHMNAAFLGPDEQHFDEHVAIWNQNCIFCHNTGPEPNISNYDEMRARAAAGQPVNVATDARFQSRVAELGISCETCHGPGSTHAERADDFWLRTAMRFNGGRDAAIVNPVNLDHERSTQVCGQCHGQRTPKTPELIRQWVETGPTFRAGLDLHEHVDPVWRHTRAPVQGQEDLFVQRFWADGTARLSAYEYQGLLQSKCYQEAALSCIDCHTMHAGDPAGQITERNRGDAPCLRCHQDLRGEEALAAHTHHPAESDASRCYGCHMPKIVYGVMDIHRSHRIEVPDAARDAASGRPNACLNCHLEQSPQWAADRLAEWTGRSGNPVARADGADPALAEAAAILAGDPVQKSVLAWHAGRTPGRAAGYADAWRVPYLIEAMADRYPSSRRFAAQSLQALFDAWPAPAEVEPLASALARFDFIAAPSAREAVRGELARAWARLDKTAWPAPPIATGVGTDYRLDESLRAALVELGRRQDKQISVGE